MDLFFLVVLFLAGAFFLVLFFLVVFFFLVTFFFLVVFFFLVTFFFLAGAFFLAFFFAGAFFMAALLGGILYELLWLWWTRMSPLAIARLRAPRSKWRLKLKPPYVEAMYFSIAG